ncbi:MAG: MgtC/SapB family protein [Firmicutes bacterium]|nr:MgtC/SapB family protein [Bacillota bacterium]
MTDPICNFLKLNNGELNLFTITLRLLISVAVGAIIGCERSEKRHSAGLRTFVLISMASASAMITDIFISNKSNGIYMISAATVIGTAVISISSILFSSRSQIKGLTTAAGLWATGILGLATGAGLYTLTLFGLIALMCSLALFPAFEIYLKNRSNHFEMHLELTTGTYLKDFITTIRKLGLVVDDIELNPSYANSGLSVYTISVTIVSKELRKYKTHKEIIKALTSLDYVYFLEEIER